MYVIVFLFGLFHWKGMKLSKSAKSWKNQNGKSKVQNNFFWSRYIRISPERFECLRKMVGTAIQNNNNNFREPISAEERLLTTLRFLATWSTQQSLAYSFRLGKSTISSIIIEKCDAIFNFLKSTYLSPPESLKECLKISAQFEEI